MKISKTLFLIFLLSYLFIGANAQTIDYSYEALSTTSCNVFSAQPTIDSRNHSTSLSRPRFEDNSIRLFCKKTSGNNISATIYAIAYPFKAGYSYSISVQYKGTVQGSELYPSVGLKISTTNEGVITTVDCPDPSNYPAASANTFSMGTSGSNYGTATILNSSTLPQAASYLLVGGFPYTTSTQMQSIYVRQIQITETPPPVSFTLSPNNLVKVCGNGLAQTFTVANVYSTPGVTSYDWNLGTSNGWLYNGSAAPSTITTTSPSLDLSAVDACGSSLSNVNVVVHVGSSSYNTNAANVTSSSPVMSIVNNAVCNPTTSVSISPLPCGASVSWLSSNTSVATVSASGNPATINKISNGNFTLTATISNVCGKTEILTKPISVGGIVANAPDYAAAPWPYTSLDVRANTDGSAPYYWYVDNVLVQTQMVASPVYFTINGGGCGFHVLRYDVSGPCGLVSSPNVYYERTCPHFMASPNPAVNSVIISASKDGSASAKSSTAETHSIKIVQIYDKTGNLKKQLNFQSGVKSTTVDVSFLPADTYILKIFDGEKWEQIKILVTSK